jgi:hypothetical protein
MNKIHFFFSILLLCRIVYGQYELLPEPIYNSSNAVCDSFTQLCESGSYPGGIALAKNMKGPADDSIRLVTFQSIPNVDSVFISVATDTAAASFGRAKFRQERIYTGSTYDFCSWPVTAGNVDNDSCTDIVAAYRAGYEVRLLWLEWNTMSHVWSLRDSIILPYSLPNDIIIGDVNNDGQDNEIFVSTWRSYIFRAVWTGSAWDTTTIALDGPYCTALDIGDGRSDLPGNELYAAGNGNQNPVEGRLWMVRWNGSSWVVDIVSKFDWPLDNTFGLANGVAVADIDPTRPGNEIAVCCAHSGGGQPFILDFHLAMLNWNDPGWNIKTWKWADSMGIGCNFIKAGDVLPENPGDELVITCNGLYSRTCIFWIAPNGSAWRKQLPIPHDGRLAIGDVNRFRNLSEEMVFANNTSYIECETHDYINDVGVYYYNMHNKTSVRNKPDTIECVILNAGTSPQSGFAVGYRFKNSSLSGSATYNNTLEPSDTGLVKLPLTMDFLGMDTLCVFTELGTDGSRLNDTVCMHAEVYDESTHAATGFNPLIFPPVNGTSPPYDWASAKTQGFGYIWWFRDQHPVYPPGPSLEGYAGIRYPCYGMPRYEHCRIRTHKFNTGDHAEKIFTKLYSFYDVWQEWVDPETLIVEYSYNDTAYIPVLKFLYNPSLDGWYAHDVEIGDFPPNTDLYIGIRATSGGGGCDFFIDSVRVYGRAISAVSESPPDPLIPDSFFLENKGPSPCRSRCVVTYGVAEESPVVISVYNAVGQHVRTILNKVHKRGRYSVIWDGLDRNGRSTPAGVYLIRMSASSAVFTKKIVLVK